MPCGKKNCPSPLPEIPAWHEEVQVSKAAAPSCTPQPKVRRKVPVFVNFWMRSFCRSATKTFPLPSTAGPTGLLNCPSPLPKLPHLVRNVPVFVNFSISWLFRSLTKTFPPPSTATLLGALNCPSPLPALPHVVRKVPQGASAALNS